MSTGSVEPISAARLALSALLLAANLSISFGLKLGLERTLLIAALRMTAQLLLVGLVLEWVFALSSPLPVLAVTLVMAAVAGISAVRRTRYRFAGIYWNALVAVGGCAYLVTGISVTFVLELEDPLAPQYFIPLLGMVLGNAINAISLGLDRFTGELSSGRERVETLLALGATRWEAGHDALREALRTAMVPLINSMMVMGVVSLPGMMTGQILAGADPAVAVRYQIVIVFMIASTTATGAIVVLLLAFRRLFDAGHRLRVDRLEKVDAAPRRRR